MTYLAEKPILKLNHWNWHLLAMKIVTFWIVCILIIDVLLEYNFQKKIMTKSKNKHTLSHLPTLHIFSSQKTDAAKQPEYLRAQIEFAGRYTPVMWRAIRKRGRKTFTLDANVNVIKRGDRDLHARYKFTGIYVIFGLTFV